MQQMQRKNSVWVMLLAAGVFLSSLQLVLKHLSNSSATLDLIRGFCVGLGATLCVGALVMAKVKQRKA